MAQSSNKNLIYALSGIAAALLVALVGIVAFNMGKDKAKAIDDASYTNYNTDYANPTSYTNKTTTLIENSNNDTPQGLVENGDFSLGTEGFVSDYKYVNKKGPNALFVEGKYAIGKSPSNYHKGFIKHGDHTTGTGNMLIANGHPDNSKYVWRKKFNVEEGVTYEFSAWYLSACTGHATLDKNMIEYTIDETSNLGVYDKKENGWCRYYYRYTATRTGTIEIKIRTKSSVLVGNDFAIDDIFFTRLY